MLLTVSNLSTSFPVNSTRFKAVNNVSFSLKPGEALGIVGESGSGKSVTGLSIMGLIQKPGQIDQGKILFQNQNLLGLEPDEMRKIRGKKISMIFQEPMTSLNPVFTVGDQILETLNQHMKLRPKEALELCYESLKLVGIDDPERRMNFYPHQLSGGLRQRIMIAMALICRPEILIADEPTTALDVTIQSQILSLIKSLQKKLGMAVIMITHDFGVIAEVADRVLVMYAGKIVEEADVNQIFDSPQHPYTRALQRAIPRAESRGKKLYSLPFMVPRSEELVRENILEQRWITLESDLKKAYAETDEVRKKEATSNIVEVSNLKKFYPIRAGFLGKTVDYIRAVNEVSFSIPKGEILGLVGESGCGKSTLGRCLLGLEKSDSGSIRVGGHELAQNESLVRRMAQIVFQDPFSSLNPRMRIGSVIKEALKIHHIVPKLQMNAEVKRLLEIVGLPEEASSKYPHEFSGGQRQRVGIARALAVRPEFIVADEPVSALDVSIQAQILNLLKDLRKTHDLSFLFISHDLNVVQYLCDRILVMHRGKIVDELSPSQALDPSHKKHDYTLKLMSAIPIRHPRSRRIA